jgi:uncharacterized protein (TIGR03435 family)
MEQAFEKRPGTVLLASLLLIGGALSLHAQAAASGATKPTPVYEVSTVKPNNTASGSTTISIDDGMLHATNVSLKMMLDAGFGIKPSLIYGLPGWAQSQRYDIVAKVVDADKDTLENLTRDQRREMIRQLIIERFQLKTHIEVKTLPVYDLVVAKDGLKIKPTPKVDGVESKDENTNVNNQSITAKGCKMVSLASLLADQVERKVIDKTGLSGGYDLSLKWQRDDAPKGNNGAEDLPDIFTAVQEQLGLKLEADKGPVDTLVIDHIEVPTEN